MLSLYDIGQEYSRATKLFYDDKLTEAMHLCLFLSDALEMYMDPHDLPAKFAAHSTEDLAWHCYYSYSVSHMLFYHLDSTTIKSASPLTYGRLAADAARIVRDNHLPNFGISDPDVGWLLHDIARRLGDTRETPADIPAYVEAIDFISQAIDRGGPDPDLLWQRGVCEAELGHLYTQAGPDSKDYQQGKELSLRGLQALVEGLLARYNEEESIDYFLEMVDFLTVYSDNSPQDNLRILKRVAAQIEEFIPASSPVAAPVIPLTVPAASPISSLGFAREGYMPWQAPAPPTQPAPPGRDPLEVVLAHLTFQQAMWHVRHGQLADADNYFQIALQQAPRENHRKVRINILQNRSFCKAARGFGKDIPVIIRELESIASDPELTEDELHAAHVAIGFAGADYGFAAADKAALLEAYQRVIDAPGFDASEYGHLWDKCIAMLFSSYLLDDQARAEGLINEVEELLATASTDDEGTAAGVSEDLHPFVVLARMKLHGYSYFMDPDDEDSFPDDSVGGDSMILYDMLLLHELAAHKCNYADIAKTEDEFRRRGVSDEYLRQLKWFYGS